MQVARLMAEGAGQVSHRPTAPRPSDEEAHPAQVGFFGFEAIVKVTYPLTNLIEKPVGDQRRAGDFAGIVIPVHKHSILMQTVDVKVFFSTRTTLVSAGLKRYPVICWLHQS